MKSPIRSIDLETLEAVSLACEAIEDGFYCVIIGSLHPIIFEYKSQVEAVSAAKSGAGEGFFFVPVSIDGGKPSLLYKL